MIEPAGPAHAAALAAIHAAAFPPGERWGAEVMALQLGQPGAFGRIDPRGGLILLRVAADEAEILTLAVDLARRRAGIGRALLASGVAEAGRRGALRLFLEVAEDNGPARALYAADGFAEIGRRRAYYPSAADALVMRRFIACGSTAG